MQYPDEAPPGEADAGDAGWSRCSYCSYTCESDACLNEHVKTHHDTASDIYPSLGDNADGQQPALEQPRDSQGVDHAPPEHPYQPSRRCDDRGAMVAFPPGRANFRCQPHSRAKSLRSDICHKRFPRALNLALHWRKHVDGAFTCQICGAKIVRFDIYMSHVQRHAEEKPHACSFCPVRFRREKYRKDHEIAYTTLMRPTLV